MPKGTKRVFGDGMPKAVDYKEMGVSPSKLKTVPKYGKRPNSKNQ